MWQRSADNLQHCALLCERPSFRELATRSQFVWNDYNIGRKASFLWQKQCLRIHNVFKMMRNNVPDLNGSKISLKSTLHSSQEFEHRVNAHQVHVKWVVFPFKLYQTLFNHDPHMKHFQPRRLFQTWWKDLESSHISRVGQHWLVAMILSPDSVLRLALRFPYNC